MPHCDHATVVAFTPRVTRMARRATPHHHPVLDKGDMVQEGLVGLLQALRSYDPAKGAVQTYVGKRIHGAMQDALRTTDRLTRSQREQGMSEPRMLSLDQLIPSRNPEAVRQERWLLKQTLYAIVPDHQPPVEAMVLDRALCAALERACQTLPLRMRLMLHLYYVQSLSMAEVGQRLGVSESAISLMHARALKRLRPLLAPWRTP